jgi:O-antigen/teichoic acid export membrane protein
MPKHFFKILDKVTPGASRSLGWEILMSALSLPASISLNRTLGAEDRGLLALMILVPSTIFVLGSCQWDRLLKGLITSQQISGREAWRRTIYYAWVLSLIFIPVGIIVSIFFDKLPQELRLLSIFYNFDFPIYFLCGCLSTIYISIGSIDGQYLMRIGYQGSYLILLFGLLFSGMLSVKSMIFLYIAIHIINLAFGWFQKERLLAGILLKEKPPLSPLIKAFLPYSLESFSNRIDVWAFSIFGSLASLGHYTGITALMLPVGLVSNAMTSGSTARLDWTQPNLVLQYLLKALTVFLCLLVVLLLGGILTGPYLLSSVLGKSFQNGYWMIPWIAVIVVGQAAAIQFHTALQLSGLLNEYLMIQTIEPLARLIIVLTLGWWLSELGIMLSMAILPILKVIVCYYVYKNRSKKLNPVRKAII